LSNSMNANQHPLAGFRFVKGVCVACGVLAVLLTATHADTKKISGDVATKQKIKLAAPGPKSWPSFRNGDAQLGVATSDLPAKLELLWKIPAKDGVVATPAIVGNHVYVGILGGKLLCIQRQTGDIVWEYQSVEEVPKNSFAPGFQSAPTVTADSVYIGDEDGVFHAVDRATGKKRWTFQTNAEIISATAIRGENVIFGSYDSNLYCLKASDGSKQWQVETNDRINGSPAISGDYTFVTGCDEHLRVINIAKGKEEFNMPLATYLIASPAVDGDMLYVGTYASEVIAVNWKKQEVVWRYKDPKREYPYHSSAAVTDKYVVVGGRDKAVHCINRANGDGVWRFQTRSRVDSSPVVVGDRVFVGSSDGNLYGLGLKDGKELWKYRIGKPITGSAAVGESCLVIGSEGTEGMIYCFGAK